MTIENAMILAAGLGSRMRPITDKIPKPLVPISGKPLIDYAFDLLREAGCQRIVVNVHHLAEQLVAHLRGIRDVEIIISDERSALLDSGGGLAKGLKLLPPGPVMVMNSDLFWIGESITETSNLRRLAAFFDPDRMDIAMLCVRLEDTTGHNGKIDFSLRGDATLIRHHPGAGQEVIYAGALVLDSALLADAPDGPFNLNIYFDRAIARGRLCGMILGGHWITAGTPESVGMAEAAVTRNRGTV